MKGEPWRFQFYLNDIKSLSSSMGVVFRQAVRLANEVVDRLAKEWDFCDKNSLSVPGFIFFVCPFYDFQASREIFLYP